MRRPPYLQQIAAPRQIRALTPPRVAFRPSGADLVVEEARTPAPPKTRRPASSPPAPTAPLRAPPAVPPALREALAFSQRLGPQPAAPAPSAERPPPAPSIPKAPQRAAARLQRPVVVSPSPIAVATLAAPASPPARIGRHGALNPEIAGTS